MEQGHVMVAGLKDNKKRHASKDMPVHSSSKERERQWRKGHLSRSG